jgi:hypothetical protein
MDCRLEMKHRHSCSQQRARAHTHAHTHAHVQALFTQPHKDARAQRCTRKARIRTHVKHPARPLSPPPQHTPSPAHLAAALAAKQLLLPHRLRRAQRGEVHRPAHKANGHARASVVPSTHQRQPVTGTESGLPRAAGAQEGQLATLYSSPVGVHGSVVRGAGRGRARTTTTRHGQQRRLWKHPGPGSSSS